MSVLDLQSAFARPGAATENFENEAGAVEHLGTPGIFEIALLNGRERAIHDDNPGVVGFDEPGDLFHFAGAEIGRRPHGGEHHDAALGDIKVDCASKPDSFVEARGRVPFEGDGARRCLSHDGLDDKRASGRQAFRA
jgi:hypothetical protein